MINIEIPGPRRLLFLTIFLLCFYFIYTSPYAYSAVVSVTPPQGGSATLATGGTAQLLTSAGSVYSGCLIMNGGTAALEGIGAVESIWIDITGATTGTIVSKAYGGTAIEIVPGQSFSCPGGLASSIMWNATTTGHVITALFW